MHAPEAQLHMGGDAFLKKLSKAEGQVMSETFVLIHGSWHGGWAWDHVIRELCNKGHRAHAPTLAGHGPGVVRRGITHEDCVDSVVEYVDRQALEDIILVGHSFGGTIVQRAAQRIATRVARLVFLNALVLGEEQCVYDNLPAGYVTAFRALAAASSDDTMLIPWEIWRDNFMQDAPEVLARSFWEQLCPEPNQVNLDRLDMKAFSSLAIPRSFIHCRQDRALPPGYFHPRMSSRLGDFRLLEMEGSHEVMFTRPAELADKLIEASSD
jgi:pimeloyl-ACP methyl ester carboxylesterase